MTEFSANLTFDKQETTVLASRVPGGSVSASDELEHALRATSVDLAVEARTAAGGTLVLTAEESDDGESWSEIEAIGTLTRTGGAALTVTPTKEWLRVSWTGGGGWTIDVTATGHATIEAGNVGTGGGGSQPFALNEAVFTCGQAANGSDRSWSAGASTNGKAALDPGDSTRIVCAEAGWYSFSLYFTVTGSPTPDIELKAYLEGDTSPFWYGHGIEWTGFAGYFTFIARCEPDDYFKLVADFNGSIMVNATLGVSRIS